MGEFNIGDFLARDVAPIAGMGSTFLQDIMNLAGFFMGQEQRQPGAWGKVSPDQAAGWPMPGVFGGGGRKMAVAGALGPEGGGELISFLREVMPSIAGMPLMLGQIDADERARKAGSAEAEGAIQTIAESVPAERLERLRSLDPTVISQSTFDKNAAAIIDGINRQAARTAEGSMGAAAARGLGPEAIEAIRSQTAMTGVREAKGDIAKLDLTRSMVNDEASRAWEALIGNLGSQVQGQKEPFQMAKVGFAGTPPDFSSIINAILREHYMKSEYDPAAFATMGNVAGERGGEWWSMYSDNQARQDLKEAAEPQTDWMSWSGMIPDLLQAGTGFFK